MEFNKRAFITEAETLALIRYVKKVAGDVVEVGTYLGGTTENIAPYIPEGQALWSVDHFEGCQHDRNPSTLYHKYLVDFKNVFFVMGDSRELGKYWDRDIGFLFIDGDHSAQVVAADFAEWTPWLATDGIVALHDSTGFERGSMNPRFRTLNNQMISGQDLVYEPGPEEVVRVALESGEWEVIEEIDTITFLARVERRS